MGYPKVSICNSTPYRIDGKVDYLSALCADDDYVVASRNCWHADHRGVCLVTEITASVSTPNGPTEALPYVSSGTSYSKFAVISAGEQHYAVVRIASEDEDGNTEVGYQACSGECQDS